MFTILPMFFEPGHVENEISNSTSIKKKKKREREEQKHNPTSKTFLKLLKKISLVTLVTDYRKLALVLSFESCYCYFK